MKPWKVSESRDNLGRYCVETEDEMWNVARVYELSHANLIAAAPEMAAFIEKVLADQVLNGASRDAEYIRIAKSILNKIGGAE